MFADMFPIDTLASEWARRIHQARWRIVNLEEARATSDSVPILIEKDGRRVELRQLLIDAFSFSVASALARIKDE